MDPIHASGASVHTCCGWNTIHHIFARLSCAVSGPPASLPVPSSKRESATESCGRASARAPTHHLRMIEASRQPVFERLRRARNLTRPKRRRSRSNTRCRGVHPRRSRKARSASESASSAPERRSFKTSAPTRLAPSSAVKAASKRPLTIPRTRGLTAPYGYANDLGGRPKRSVRSA